MLLELNNIKDTRYKNNNKNKKRTQKRTQKKVKQKRIQ